MRAIDIDHLIKDMEEIYCRKCDNWDYIKCRTCIMDDVFAAMNAEPTLDVIPISFVNRLMFDGKLDDSKAAWRVLRAWKENLNAGSEVG